MDEKPLRLFLAVSVPADRSIWLAEATAGWRELWPGARWTKRDNQHVTLKFLGPTPPDLLEPVTAACLTASKRHLPSPLRLGDAGVFPNERRARVLWVGLDDPSALLAGLAGDLDAALEPLGFRSEARPYTAHLTLARFKTPVAIGDLPGLPEPPPAFTPTSIGLWRSHLSPRGADYERLAELPLSHAP